MCLQLKRKTKEEPKLKTARKDITIYKVVEEVKKGIYFSPYYDFQYKLGKKNKRIELEPQYAYTISGIDNRELHFYYGIYEGYHAYKTLKKARFIKEKMDFANNPVILKGNIPQGEKYLTNDKGEIVASNIILTEELK